MNFVSCDLMNCCDSAGHIDIGQTVRMRDKIVGEMNDVFGR
jgi:hypothetical protein